MSLSATDLEIIPIAGLVLVAAFIALLMDYLKSYNDQLRERNIDLAARHQERDRWFGNNPDAFFEKIATLLRSAQGLPAPASAAPVMSGASARARHRAASYGRPAPQGAAAQGSVVVEEQETEGAFEGHGLPETDLAGIPAEMAARPSRARSRRDEARTESWVSKEELEKLAERAARIRARYGNMVVEDTSEEAARPTESSPADISSGMVGDSGSPELYAEPVRPTSPSSASQGYVEPEPAQFAESPLVEPAHPHQDFDGGDQVDGGTGAENTWVFRESSSPIAGAPPSSSTSYVAESVSFVTEVEQVSTSEIHSTRPDYPQDLHNNYEREQGEAAPVWDIPSSPAQAAVSAAVSPREDGGAASAVAPSLPSSAPQSTVLMPAPAGLSVVPSYPSSSLAASGVVLQEPQVSLPAQARQEASAAEQEAAAQHDVDLDALFDQTYGSPSWLAMNGQEATSAADSVLPTGLFEGNEFGTLMAEAPLFTGVAVSIRINDFASVKPKLSSIEGVEAMGALSNLIRSLLREDRDFAGRSQEDEYVLLFPGDIGDEGQRRLFHLSERLWDFQLRSLGGLALMLSWGGLEVNNMPVPEAVTAARDRLEESRRGRAKPGSTFRSARRVS